MSDHEQVKVLFDDAVAALLADGVTYDARQLGNNSHGERDTVRCFWTITKGSYVMTGTYSAGSAVPLFDFVADPAARIPEGVSLAVRTGGRRSAFVLETARKGSYGHVSIDEAAVRRAIRAQWVPKFADVLASVLLDDASVEGCEDFLAWGEEMGSLQDATAESLRELRDGFAKIQALRMPLRRILGERFDTMRDQAVQL